MLFAFIFLLCFISIFIHGITESTFFFEGNAKGITITLLFFIPPLSMRHRYHFSGKKELLFYRNMSETKLNINLITRVMANTLLMIFLGSVTVLFTHTVYVRKLAYIFIILAGSSLFLLLLVTPLIHHWGAHEKFKESFKMVIRCSFLSNLLNFFITLIIGGFFAIILSHLLLPSVLTILFIMFANMSIYFALLIFIKNDENKLTIDVVNDYLLYRISKTI